MANLTHYRLFITGFMMWKMIGLLLLRTCPAPAASQRAKFSEKVHKPSVVVNVIKFGSVEVPQTSNTE